MRIFHLSLRWGLPPLLALGGFAFGYAVFFPGLAGSRLSDGSEASFKETAARISQGDLLDQASPMERVAWLLEVCKQPRSLNRDAALFEAIQRLQPSDFVAAVTDVSELSKWFSSLEDGLRAEVIEAVLERWMEVDEEGLLRWLPIAQRIIESGTFNLPKMGPADLNAIYSVLARRNPAWVFEHLEGLGAKMCPEVAIRALMRSAGEADSPQAELWLASFKKGPHYKAALETYTEALASSDPERALNKALSEAPQDRRLPVKILVAAAPRSPNRAAALFGTLSETTRRDVIQSMFPVILGLDRNFDLLSWLDAEISRDPQWIKVDGYSNFNYLAMGLALRDGGRAMEWLEKLEEPGRTAIVDPAATSWANANPNAFLEWLIAHPEQNLPLRSYPLDILAASNPELFAKWMKTLQEGNRKWLAQSVAANQLIERGRSEEAMAIFPKEGTGEELAFLAQQFGSRVAGQDASRVTNWLENLQSGPLQQRATQGVIALWLLKSPEAVTTWAENLPPGTLRDSAAGAIATTIAERDFEGARQWLSEVKSDSARDKFIAEVYKKRYGQNPAQAVAWLRSLPGMSATIRNRLLETHP